MTAPVLVFGYGNPSRGDDALGPEFVRRLEQRLGPQIERGELEVLTDYQLQIEHALDLKGRRWVFFVDASEGGRVSKRADETHPVPPERSRGAQSPSDRVGCDPSSTPLGQNGALLPVSGRTDWEERGFEVRAVSASRDATFTTHLLSPQALLHTFEEIEQVAAPPAWTIAIRGERFELGEPMSEAAEQHLTGALADFEGTLGRLR